MSHDIIQETSRRGEIVSNKYGVHTRADLNRRFLQISMEEEYSNRSRFQVFHLDFVLFFNQFGIFGFASPRVLCRCLEITGVSAFYRLANRVRQGAQH